MLTVSKQSCSAHQGMAQKAHGVDTLSLALQDAGVSAGQLHCCSCTAVPAGWPSLRATTQASAEAPALSSQGRQHAALPAAWRGGCEGTRPSRRSPGGEMGAGEGQGELQGFGHAPVCAALFSHTETVGD